MKGEDSWMANFADWMIYLAESTRLFKEELIGTFNAIKEFRIGDAVSGSLVQNTTQGLGEVNIFKMIADYAKEKVGMEVPTKQQAMIPYANPNMSPPTNQSGVLKGEARVHITVDQNGKVTQQTQSIPLKWDFGSLGSR